MILRETDQPFFEKYIQDLKLNEMLQLDPIQLGSESQQHIWKNCQTLRELLLKSFKDNEEEIARFARFLVTRCYLVVVSTPNQPSAYRVFSVMNSRGLDLLPTDIIKADVVARIPEQERDHYAKRWEELEDLATRDGFEDVFSHTRMVYGKRKAKRALNEEFKSFVIDSVYRKETDETVAPKRLFDEVIDPMTTAYITVKQNDYHASSNSDEVNRKLMWLNRINNSDWIPVAMAFMRAWGNDSEYVMWFMGRLERLAAYLLVTSKGINKRIVRYSEVLEEMERRPNSALSDPLQSIDLTASERQEFLDALNGEIYTKASAVRKYIVLRLDSFIGDGAASYSPSVFTIEHVLPQKIENDSEWMQAWSDDGDRARWLNRIANLVPLNRRRNSAAQNYDFKVKKEKYFKGNSSVSSYALTTQVLAEDEWIPGVVARRQEDLLGVFKDGWDL